MSRNGPTRTKIKRRLLALGFSLAMGLAASVSTGSAQAGTTVADKSPRKILEVDVTNDPGKSNGQPAVAVNPKNPDNVVYISTDHGPGATPDTYGCYAAHSEDGGATWTRTPWPYGDRAMCGDPYLAVDAKGVFYTAFNRLGCPPGTPGGGLGSCNGVPNHVAVARSLDGGRTWSDPVDTPLFVATTPRLRVDTATGAVYAVGGYTSSRPHAVSVSRDGGLTWSASSPLPDQPFGNQVAVNGGTLMTATALKLTGGGTQVEPSEVTISVSRDSGQTFTSSVLTDGDGAPVAPPSGSLVPTAAAQATDPIPWITADPKHVGRFAVMLPRGDNLEVYTTKNAGRDWSGPAVIPAPGAVKPWIEYGSTGELGVMWRTTAVDVYSTVSFDRGKTFTAPLKVNRVTYPTNQQQPGGDEWSRIVIDGKYAYVTWADSRTGGAIDGIVGRVPLSLYKERPHSH